MNAKLLQLLRHIEQRLLATDIIAFKISKSDNSQQRFLQYDEPYHYLGIIAIGSATDINNAEIDLINWAKNNCLICYKCQNINNGGGGNPNAAELYIVAQKANADLGEHLLEPDNLFEFQPISL